MWGLALSCCRKWPDNSHSPRRALKWWPLLRHLGEICRVNKCLPGVWWGNSLSGLGQRFKYKLSSQPGRDLQNEPCLCAHWKIYTVPSWAPGCRDCHCVTLSPRDHSMLASTSMPWHSACTATFLAPLAPLPSTCISKWWKKRSSFL